MARITADTVAQTHAATFGFEPIGGVFAPGRVNLIGDHTDYNDGFVFPVALEIGTYIAYSRNTDGRIRARSMNMEAQLEREVMSPVRDLSNQAMGSRCRCDMTSSLRDCSARREESISSLREANRVEASITARPSSSQQVLASVAAVPPDGRLSSMSPSSRGIQSVTATLTGSSNRPSATLGQ